MRNPKSKIQNPKSFRSHLVAWFKKNGRDLPWRGTRDPYAVLVSEVMLQQTQVATVVDYFNRWMKRFPDFPSLAAATEADVLHAWQGLGYYSRARNLHRAAQIVMTQYGGKFPDALDAIRALPGIGRYTAGAVATFAFDQSTPIIDANIARVLSRLFNICLPVDTAAGQNALWQIAENLQPQKKAGAFNESLMELGATVCLPRQPRCEACPVRNHCRAPQPESLPRKKARRATEAATENCAFIFSKGKILLQQNLARRWRGLWTLPAIASCQLPVADCLCHLTYPFTHHRVTLAVFALRVPKRIAANQRWFDSVEEVPMPSPHRRALQQLFPKRDNRQPLLH